MYLSDTLYERYNTGDNTYVVNYGAYWTAQTFTIGNTGTNEDHNITSVKLLLARAGSPGTVTVSIRATDGSGYPTGNDLTSGTLNGNDFTTDSAGLWYEFTLTPYGLSASTKYAVVERNQGTNPGNTVKWRLDTTTPTYTGGSYFSSGNSGSVWTPNTDYDTMFEEYGLSGGAALSYNASDTMAISDSIATKSVMKFAKADTMAISDAGGVAASLAMKHTAADTVAISDAGGVATVSIMKYAAVDTMTIGDVIATVSAMKHAAADTMDISDVGGVIASLQMKLDLADQMDISDSAVFVLSEAEKAAIRRLRMIYGLKPARIPKIGHVGV